MEHKGLGICLMPLLVEDVHQGAVNEMRPPCSNRFYVQTGRHAHIDISCFFHTY